MQYKLLFMKIELVEEKPFFNQNNFSAVLNSGVLPI
jgi:hypothetical protein